MSRRLDSLSGKTIGLVDNTKRNSDLFLKQVGEELRERYGAADVVYVRKANANTPAPEELRERYGAADVVYVRKANANTPAPDELLDEVSSPSDAVVHAVAD